MEWVSSAVGGLVGLVLELGGLILGGLLLAVVMRVVWFQVGIRIPVHVRPAVSTLRRRLADLGPLAQILLCITTVLATALVLRFPGTGPWAPIMAEEHGDGLSTTMLAGATALLVLLTFAGSRARWAEEDARENDAAYLGQIVATYEYLHSPWTALTRQRAFQALVIALFVVPVLLAFTPAASSGAAVPWAGPAENLLTALWCAAFALVGITLIMHLTSSLRISMPDAAFAQQMIRWDLEEDSRAEWNDLLRDSAVQDPPRRILHEWAQRHVSVARALPLAEREGYLRATVCQGDLLDSTRSLLFRAARTLRRADRADPEIAGALPWWRTWPQSRRVQHRRDRARAMVDAVERAQSARIRTFADALTTGALGGEDSDSDARSIATLLGRHVILSAQQVDGAHRELTRIRATACAESLLTPSDHLPDPRLRRARPWRRGATSPQVLMITATGFRDLARAAFAPPRRQVPVPPGIPLEDLLEEAERIRHAATREYVLDEIVTHFLRGVVIDGSPVEAPEALEKIVTRRRKRADSREAEGADGSAAEDPLVELIARRAFDVLTHSGDLAPETIEHLLALLDGWRIPCALLHALLYSRRSGRELSAAQLAPYARAMRYRVPLDAQELDDLEEHALTILRDPSYNTSHFTTDEGISWLVRSLEKRLTSGLCSEFARQKESFEIQELRLLEFVQWHLVAGAGLGAPTRDPGDEEVSEDSAAALWTFCRSWDEIDRRGALDLRLWLRGAVGPEPEPEQQATSHYTWDVRTRHARLSGH